MEELSVGINTFLLPETLVWLDCQLGSWVVKDKTLKRVRGLEETRKKTSDVLFLMLR